MFANYTLTAEIARQRQHDLIARSVHRHWFRRIPTEVVTAAAAAHTATCSVIELPAQRPHVAAAAPAADDALVA
jgi:hypothetical protein